MVCTFVAHLQAKEGKDVEEKVRSKLIEASHVYTKDPETINWFVMQDHADSTKWTIVERYEQESSLEIHRANPFFAEFVAYMGPLLAAPMDLRKYNELE